MYKSKLQELCHQKSWDLPEYTATKQGPDHNPRFQATVIVNNVSFTTLNLCKSSKEAQNDAARIAFEHFTSSPPKSSPSPSPSPSRPAVSSSSGSLSASSLQLNIQQTDQTPQVSATTSVVKDDYRFRANQTLQVNAQTTVGRDVFGSRDQTPLVNATSSVIKDVYRSRGSSSASTVQMSIQQTDQIPQVSATTSVIEDNYRLRDQTPQVNGTTSIGLEVSGSRDTLHLFKNQLQSYAQKRNLAFPLYSCEREGPPHASRFKGKVTIDGQTFESREFFPTLKEAEHGAAKVALMSLSPDRVQEDDCGFYKNLLQELAQKEGYVLPVYHTTRSGEAHLPTFVSTVEVEGEVFTGQEAKTKKQAEMSAAKVAYLTLKERKPKRPAFPSTAHQAQVDYTSSSSESNSTANGHQKVQPMGHVVLNPSLIQAEEQRVNDEVSSQHLLDPFPQPVILKNWNRESSPSDPSAPSMPENIPSSSPLFSDCTANYIPEYGNEVGVVTDTSSSTRIRVFPLSRNMIIPQGSTVLRSDDNWVAIKLGSQSNR